MNYSNDPKPPRHTSDTGATDRQHNEPSFQYDPAPLPARHTTDTPYVPSPKVEQALAAIRALVDYTDEDGEKIKGDMHVPHVGTKLSQRKAAHLLFAGRTYQALQRWLAGEPMPEAAAEWIVDTLQRVDALEQDRMVRVNADEIAIIVKR